MLTYPSVWLELRSIFNRLSTDPSVRVVVFSGAGEKAFSVGIDLKWISKEGSPFVPRPDAYADPARRAAALRRFGLEFQECINSIEKCEKRMYSSFSFGPLVAPSGRLKIFVASAVLC